MSKGCFLKNPGLMGKVDVYHKGTQIILELIIANSVLGFCPPRWTLYRDELCLYFSASPALSWNESRVFCQDQKADLVVIKDYSKQMFLAKLTDGTTRPYWIGLAWHEAKAELTWVDGVPISQTWYSNWLQGHPKAGLCVQLVGIYASQWRDGDCGDSHAFVCEMPVKDAFPGFVRKLRFRSLCYTFHFPSFREVRSWREAQAFCQEYGQSLAIIHDAEENTFLSEAFPEDGWHMWIGLRFGTTWQWCDSSPPLYFPHDLEKAPPKTHGQCVVLNLQPSDPAQHGTWKTRPCGVRPTTEITGFICQHRSDFCGLPEPVHFPLPGGLVPASATDVAFSFSNHTSCTLSLVSRHGNATHFRLSLEADATHVRGSIVTQLGGFLVHKNLPHVPFSHGLNMWSFIAYADGLASFFNHQEHFRLSSAQGISLEDIGSLQVTGATVINASLAYRLSSDLHFPRGSGLQLENAVQRYLSNFTIGLWVRSSTVSNAPKMCLISYSLKWRQPEFALFLLSPSGLEFHSKGAVIFSGSHKFLLDGSWHHVAVSVSGTPHATPCVVFIDGEPWEPQILKHSSFLQKGLSLGGKLSVGLLEEDNRATSFYVGDLSEVNLWDRALPELSVRQLAASRTREKFPGNVVSWNQLLAKKPPSVQSSSPSKEPDAVFLWFGILRLTGKSSVLCADPAQSLIYVEPVPNKCPQQALWGMQQNGRLRNVANPSSCLTVTSAKISLSSSKNCSTDVKSSFRLLPDQRLQNLHSGLCVFQEVTSTKLHLGQCTPQALYFALDQDVYCPRSASWRSRKDKCFFLVLEAALEWSQALRFCQRFHGGSLVTLDSPQDLIWLQAELEVSAWTGLHSRGKHLWRWADGAPFNTALQRFIFSQGAFGRTICMLALSSGLLKAEPCHRPHRWICQAPRQTDLYMRFPGKSFYGALSVEQRFPSLLAAERQCAALGRGCDVLLSSEGDHYLAVGTRFASPDDVEAGAATAVHVKTRCSPGYSGEDCQSACRHCAPGLSCNPLTGLCDGFLVYQEKTAAYASLKCLPLGDWVFERGACVSSMHFGSQEEAATACKRYLGATVQRVQHPQGQARAAPSGDGGQSSERGGFSWACQRPEDVQLPSFWEMLLVSSQGLTLQQRCASLQEAQDNCYLQKEGCTGILHLKGAYYVVAGTVLVESPGSGALLYVKAACSPGFCGPHCQTRCSPCLSTRTYNPLTGQCDGLLSCMRRFSPACAHGLVHRRCPQHPGWWFWAGHCYYVEEQRRDTWQGAQEACRAHGEHVGLLTLSSTKEKAWAAAMVQEDCWMGLNDVDKDGVWTWAGGQVADLQAPWLVGTQLLAGNCATIGPQEEQQLSSISCSELRPWVCKGTWAPWSSCPTEPGWHHWNSSCYFWDASSVVGWQEALRSCRRFKNAELLYLTSPQELNWICSNFQGSFWTGLNDLKEESVFRWTTQETLSQQLAQYLRDDMADGGLKDCVFLDTATGLLADASCAAERPFLCKLSKATEWFDEHPGHGVAGEPSLLYPSVESLGEAKHECLQERGVCVAVLWSGDRFYLISSMEDVLSQPDSTLYVWTICAEGFSGPSCLTAPVPHPACDCSGRFQTTAKKVCGASVQTCIDDCQRMTAWPNCSVCLPSCTEADLSALGAEEFALLTMVQFKVSHSLNLTMEDERDRGNSSHIIYDDKYP